VRRHICGHAIARKILQEGLSWPTIFNYDKKYAWVCDVCQRVGKSSRRDELPMHPVRALQYFENGLLISLVQ
jgi:hypothetical protein